MVYNDEPRDERIYRRYLLGQCSIQETDEVEEAIVLDTDASELMAVVEDELTEDYVNGQLSERDRVSFERRYLNNQDGQRKILLMALLRNRLEIAERQRAHQTESIAASQPQNRTSSGGADKTQTAHFIPTPPISSMDFYAFDGAYVDRLRTNDWRTLAHFVAYFNELLQLKIRARLQNARAIEDVRQETFFRFFTALRDGKIRKPERLGSMLNSICNNVLLEHYRYVASSHFSSHETERELPSALIEVLRAVAAKQTDEEIREILSTLSDRDQRLLREIFLAKRDKDEVCREFEVDREYPRVLLARLKRSYRSLFYRSFFSKMPTSK